jgi:uncharacterized protein (DUF2141 family)
MYLATRVSRCVFFTLALSGAAGAAELTVTVDGFDRTGGQLMVGLFDSEASYNGDAERRAGARQAVSSDSVDVVFTGLEDGTYAIKLYHDENGNGELDRNMIGIPSEGYGFSNNPSSMGPPDFEAARFAVSGDTRISISLR